MNTEIEIEEGTVSTNDAIEALYNTVASTTTDTNEGIVEDLIGCDCNVEDTDSEPNVTLNADNKTNFDDIVQDAQKYIGERIDEFPTEEVKEGVRSAAVNVKTALNEHGIDTDVLSSKIKEDAGNILSGVLGVVATGAEALANAAETASENLKNDASEKHPSHLSSKQEKAPNQGLFFSGW